jgi:hypothetical protein
MYQLIAVSWIHVPMLEKKAPVQRRRKLREANGERKAGSSRSSLKDVYFFPGFLAEAMASLLRALRAFAFR